MRFLALITSDDVLIPRKTSFFCHFTAGNVPFRDYQFSIAKVALFSNTLVALPTGLGKTLIAAVVMYNYFRWFPEGELFPSHAYLLDFLLFYFKFNH